MITRRVAVLTILIPTLLGGLLAVFAGRLWVVPVTPLDTETYINMAKFVHAGLGLRSPAYGMLLLPFITIGQPMLFVWFQVLWWVACIAAATGLALTLTQSVWKTLLFGVAFVYIEAVMTYTLALQWWLIADPLAVDWLTLGLLLMLIGITLRRDGFLVAGAVAIGAASGLRPMLASILCAFALLVMSVVWFGYNTRRRALILSGTFLLLPVLCLSLLNKVTVGSFALSQLPGLTMPAYVLALAEPEDRVFDDPEQNRLFHETIEKKTLPAGLVPKNVYGLPAVFPSKQENWTPLLWFYSTMEDDTDYPTLRSKVHARSVRTTQRLIWLHPIAYIRRAFAQTITVMVPTERDRMNHFAVSDPYALLNAVRYGWGSQTGQHRIIGASGLDHLSADMRVGKWFETGKLGLRLPMSAGPKTKLILFAALLCMAFETVGRLRSSVHYARMFGLVIGICMIHLVLSAMSYSLVTTFMNPRYTVPGLITGELALLFMMLSVLTLFRPTET